MGADTLPKYEADIVAKAAHAVNEAGINGLWQIQSTMPCDNNADMI